MIYVTSDLHGYPLEKFQELLKSVNFGKDDFCFILGDVIDRGNDGVKILEWIMLQPNVELLLGNHEAFLLSNEFLFTKITDDSIGQLKPEQLESFCNWIDNGGNSTIDELRKRTIEELHNIVEYIKEAPLYETVSVNGRDFLLTHSALDNFDKNKSLDQYSEHDFLWHRPSMEETFFDDITCVFGHTPTLLYGSGFRGKILKTESWINVDAGAACGLSPALLRLDDLKEFYLED